MLKPPLPVADAARAVKEGAVIAYPTEAVWGLGCDPLDEVAVREILRLKSRPEEKGLILVAASLSQLLPFLAPLTAAQKQQLADVTDRPTTWLVPFNPQCVPGWISGGHDLLAVRICRHPIVQSLCELADTPLVSTSANPQGLPPAKNRDDIEAYFADAVAASEGELGNAEKPSMIRNLLTGQVIRE